MPRSTDMIWSESAVPTMKSLGLALLVAMALSTAKLCSQQVPTGFVDELVAGGFNQPVGLAFLPDGRAIVIEHHSGRVLIVAGGASQVIGTVPNIATQHFERGLLGVAVDPLWPQWPYLYFAYSHDAPASLRVVRYTASGNLSNPNSAALGLGFPLTVLPDAPDQSLFHNGGTLRFGPDDTLFLSLGDDAADCSAQDPTTLTGAILRLDIAGLRGAQQPPADHTAIAPLGNPFAGPNAQLVWALGFRNPFRFQIDSLTGLLYVGDVGASSWEELDEVQAGDNLGWPDFEGPAGFGGCGSPLANPSPPIASYANNGGASIVPVTAPYRNPPLAAFAFGAAYEGSIFFADFFQGFLRRLTYDGATYVPTPAVPGQPTPDNWGAQFGFLSDAQVGHDGAIYYIKFTPGSLRRIRPDTMNTQLSVVGTTNRMGNADWPLAEPLSVQLKDFSGTPIAGAPVTFSVIGGGGQLDVQPIVSDSLGHASTSFRLPTGTSVNPIIVRASSPGSAPAHFSVTWRGIAVDHDPIGNSISITVRHSQMASPVTLVVGLPAQPPAITLWGELGVALFQPQTHLAVIDGLGLLGPPNPLGVTSSVFPVLSFGIGGLPSFGFTAINFQAFAIDTTLYPADSAIMVSNVATVLLP